MSGEKERIMDEKKGDKMKDETKGDKMQDVSPDTEKEIIPLRDYVLHSPPLAVRVELQKGRRAAVPVCFLTALKTEKVI